MRVFRLLNFPASFYSFTQIDQVPVWFDFCCRNHERMLRTLWCWSVLCSNWTNDLLLFVPMTCIFLLRFFLVSAHARILLFLSYHTFLHALLTIACQPVKSFILRHCLILRYCRMCASFRRSLVPRWKHQSFRERFFLCFWYIFFELLRPGPALFLCSSYIWIFGRIFLANQFICKKQWKNKHLFWAFGWGPAFIKEEISTLSSSTDSCDIHTQVPSWFF